MSYLDEMVKLPTDISGELIHSPQAAEIAARADARITELQQSVTVRDTEIARLETELELALADARRYRWLRDQGGREVDTPWVVFRGGTWFLRSELDEAIDKARAGNGGGV